MKVTARAYYLASLSLPALVPLLAWHMDGVLAVIFQSSLALGGIPYGAFAIFLVLWGRRKGAEALARISWVAPILYLPFLITYLAIYQFTRPWTSIDHTIFSDVAFLTIGYSVYAIMIGYFYVVLVHAGRVALSSMKFLTE